MNTENTAPALDENQIIAERRAKLAAIRAAGIAFPNDFERRDYAGALAAAHGDKSKEALEAEAVPVQLAGRMMLKRVMGKASFATLQDMSGRIQVYVSNDLTGLDAHDAFKHWDLGDFLGVTGTLFKTNKGELTIQAKTIRLLSKALRPLPEKFHGLADQEQKYRQRYLDLITNDDARETFRRRSKIIQAIRAFMVERDFLEVETPMMHPIPGGAAAKPFATHHNALDMELFLRIAPELFLKRAVVGGIDRVFEINRNFRNEGADSTHSPEFAMLEAYQAYGDYHQMADLTQEMIQNAAVAVSGSHVVTWADGTEYDLGGTWDRLSMYDSLSAAVGVEITPQTPMAELKKLADAVDIEITHPLPGKYVEELWEHHVKGDLVRPTFVMDFPVDTSPLVREHRSRPGMVEKWDLYVRGFELATAYSELVDPVVQRERFVEQAKLAAGGDLEAMRLDEAFLTALEHGMPPSGGMGMGIDRLLMALTGLGIRETILFPLVK